MITYLLIAAAVITACVIFNRISSKLGIPMLLAFILLGMFLGSDGFGKISFDNYAFTEQICSVALIFIMFYGGFGTKWSTARPIAGKAVLLASFGTFLTAGLVGLFCHYLLKIGFLESFLIGSVISSTDAASVFSILRSKRLNLRYNTASLLEVESGSNDPFSYMLTFIILAIMNGGVSGFEFVSIICAQIIFGIIFGITIAVLALLFIRHFDFTSAGFDAIFIVAVALAAYAVPSYFGGNGYLSVYLAGIILGNHALANKQALVNFFDGMTGLMQMLLFFLLGLLSFPSQLPEVAVTGFCIAVFLTFAARPVAVFTILMPFKSNLRQLLLVSWAGMRGAASIVFAIMAVMNPATTDNDIFHIVFFIVLFSILLQGTLLPILSKKLDMTDDTADVLKTFTDYSDEVPVQFIQFTVTSYHAWAGKTISEITLPPESILVLVIREKEKIVPNGKTQLQSGDTLILGGKTADRIDGVHLYETTIQKKGNWAGKKISQIPSGEKLIIMIRRGEEVIIPTGTTTLMKNDILVINDAGKV